MTGGAATPDITAASRSILGALLVDEGVVGAMAQQVTGWVASHRDEVGAHELAWTAAQSVTAALQAIGQGAGCALDDDDLATLRGLPLAAQVTVVLHHFVGLDETTVAAETSRTVDEVNHLLDIVGEASESPAAPEAAAAPEPVAVPVPVPVAVAAPEPEPEPVADITAPPVATPVEHVVRRPRRKRPPVPTPTRPWIVAAIVVLALVAAGIAARNLRDDSPRARPPVTAGLADAESVTRRQLSSGCDSKAGDAALEAQTVDLTFDDTHRSYRIVAPAAITPGSPRPLIVDFGDLGQSIDDHVAESHLDQTAVALKAIVITVRSATKFPQWNVADTSGDADDMGFVTRVIQRERKRLCVDQTRIIAAGRGAGAHFAAAYACRNPGIVSGLVLVAGVYRSTDCSAGAGRGLSILAVLGSKDDTFPLSGGTGAGFTALASAADSLGNGARYPLASPQTALDRFVRDLRCTGTASMPLGLVTVRIATSCEGTREVWRVTVDSGHEWYPITNDLLVRFMTNDGPLAAR
ncbi:MAG: hypothetical protein U0Q22_06955 [Acidimicrobiales bacterium]